MTSLSQRARELAEQMGGQDHGGEEFSFPSMVNLKVIEQALMRERRLAMEAAIGIVSKCVIEDYPYTIERKAGNGALGYAIKQLRSAAEREVGK